MRAALMAPEFTHAAADDWINSEPLTLAGLRGNIRAVFAGETHDGDEQAQQIESTLRALLAEKPGSA